MERRIFQMLNGGLKMKIFELANELNLLCEQGKGNCKVELLLDDVDYGELETVFDKDILHIRSEDYDYSDEDE